MSDKQSDPPCHALWFLQHACPGDNEALAGDLIERFREGETRAWFWRQVLVAFAVGLLSQSRRHWPEFCYAVAGTAMQTVVWFREPSLLWTTLAQAPGILHWYDLSWPWWQIAFELTPAYYLFSGVTGVDGGSGDWPGISLGGNCLSL